VLTEYNDETLPAVLGALERMNQHLRLFQQKVCFAV